MHISVAMATYNGAHYIKDQLDSILSQERLPDELIICDDNSSDDTIEIVEGMVTDAPFPIRLLRNAERRGSIGTFQNAIEACSGDVIALCDQDDVWLPEKLAAFERGFEADDNVGLLFTDAQVVDEKLAPLQYGLWQSVGFDRSLQRKLRSSQAFDLLLSHPFVTGATLAFRSKWRSLILPFPRDHPNFIHDRWAATLISSVSSIDFIDSKLIKYRQHSQQQIGARRTSPFQSFGRRFQQVRDSLKGDLSALEAIDRRLKEHPEATVHDGFRSAVAARRQHLEARLSLPTSRIGRVGPIAAELASGRYGRCSRGSLSAAKDLFL